MIMTNINSRFRSTLIILILRTKFSKSLSPVHQMEKEAEQASLSQTRCYVQETTIYSLYTVDE